MPIYGFECVSCGHRFDRLQKLSDADPTECPECGAVGIRRQLTAPQFRLSGSGWYETDFKKDGDTRRNLSDKPDAGAGDKAGSAEKAAPSPAPEKSPAPASKPESSPKPAATPAAPSSGTGS